MARKQVKKAVKKVEKKGSQPSPPLPSQLSSHPLGDLRNEIDSAFARAVRGWSDFGDLLSDWGTPRERDRIFGGRLFGPLPKTDIVESDKDYTIALELPGVAPDDMDISVTEGRLAIKGEKRSEREEDEKGLHLSERSYGRFERSYSLPEDANVDKVDAGFENGVLNITIPKRPEARKKERKIRVTAR